MLKVHTPTSSSTQGVSTTTVWAACASNSIADAVSGQELSKSLTHGNHPSVSGKVYSLINIDTAIECCMAAFQYPNPATVWQYSPAQDNSCAIMQVAVGNPQDQTDQTWYVSEVNSGNLMLGNGYDGQIHLLNAAHGKTDLLLLLPLLLGLEQ